jgi:hypothetical protein
VPTLKCANSTKAGSEEREDVVETEALARALPAEKALVLELPICGEAYTAAKSKVAEDGEADGCVAVTDGKLSDRTAPTVKSLTSGTDDLDGGERGAACKNGRG